MKSMIPQIRSDMNDGFFDDDSSKKTTEYKYNYDSDKTSIRKLVVIYGLPHVLANRFIGQTEKETESLVAMFEDYLASRERAEVLQD